MKKTFYNLNTLDSTYDFYCKISTLQWNGFLVFLIEAIKVLITVIFRVFFDDDNELTHFFVDENPEFKNHDSELSSTKKKSRLTKNMSIQG